MFFQHVHQSGEEKIKFSSLFACTQIKLIIHKLVYFYAIYGKQIDKKFLSVAIALQYAAFYATMCGSLCDNNLV